MDAIPIIDNLANMGGMKNGMKTTTPFRYLSKLPRLFEAFVEFCAERTIWYIDAVWDDIGALWMPLEEFAQRWLK